MTILEQDLKLVHAEEDSDFDTGGGAQTATVIPDGALHNLFDSTAELDNAQGRIKVRKGFALVDTDSRDRFQQAHLVLTEIPANPLTSAVLFSTRDHFDRRPDHAAYIEAYFRPGGRFNGWLYGLQGAGNRAIEIWQSAGTPLPEVGLTYFLIEDEELASEVVTPIRVAAVASRTETLEDDRGVYTKQIATLTLSKNLPAAFHGPQIQRGVPASGSYRAIIRTAIVADAAAYFSARPTIAVANEDELEIQVDDIFVPLVPASVLPIPHANLDPSALDTTLVPSAAGTVTFTTPAAFQAGASLYLGTPFQPGSLSMAAGAATITDNGAGTVYSGSTAIGIADYAEGTITGSANCPTYIGTKTITITPAGAMQGPMQTHAIEVKANTRSTAYVRTLPVQPRPGTTRVAYRAQGRWYVLADRGDGQCVGADTSYGAATVQFATRTITLGLGAEPDVDSWILISFGASAYTFSRGGTVLGKGYFEFATAAALPPGGVAIAWNDGTARTASDDGAGGLTGDGTGEIRYAEKRIRIRPNMLPPPGTQFTVTITPRATASETFPSIPRDGAGFVDLTLAHGNVVPGSVSVESANWTFPAPPVWYPLPVPPPPRPIHQYAGISGL